MPKWLDDAVFYEIYPQSFNDTNADGIGDIAGITQKLDYIKDLGCNAIWLNPCFDSPFKDAGYDIRDYFQVAPRYGTNEDLEELFSEAHKRGMKVILDLVIGHTSEEHPWFQASQKEVPNEYSDRYIWSSFCFMPTADVPCVVGESERSGTYAINFFKSQPALNYGFLQVDQPWQKSIDDEACIATRKAVKDIMRFWLDKGCDGFRVDLADTLVKHDDEKKTGTQAVWHDLKSVIEKEYPECMLVSEWGNPPLALGAGFDCDFYLNQPGNGYGALFRDYCKGIMQGNLDLAADKSYFNMRSGVDILPFLAEYVPWYEETRGKGYISFISGNHDTPRLPVTLSPAEIKVGLAFILTMPGVPFLYYGDEIGLRYLMLPTKEGGYFRTGSRTPMQWDATKNYGFSEADPANLYLPQDPSPDAPTVAQELQDQDSLLNFVRRLITLRHEYADLQAQGPFEVLFAEKNNPLFVYKRGDIVIALNPWENETSGKIAGLKGGDTLLVLGDFEINEAQGEICLGPQTVAIWKVS